MKNYFKFICIGLLSSLLYFSCSDNSNEPQETKNVSQKNQTNKSALLQTICDITGLTVTSPGNAVVIPGSTVVYNYTNNTGTPTSIIWNVQTANPAGSITISGTGSSVSVTYAANFISGTISADGTGGTAAFCQSILNISTSIINPPQNCCSPILDGWFECRGGGQTGGQIEILNPLPGTGSCTVDWSKISKIEITISGATFTQAPYIGQTFMSLNGPFTREFAKSVYSSGCKHNKKFSANVIFYYNNGCPTVQKVGSYYDINTP